MTDHKQRLLGLGMAAGVCCLSMNAACNQRTESLDLAGVYTQPQSSICLVLNGPKRTLLMTEGTEVLSYGTYFVKWKHLYCTRNQKQIVIGKVRGDRIETDAGLFIKKSI
ncbi:MAG TPA: hypothetical protein DCZ95_11075 [Verrucomicrobia bacterium]|nr:MAG: hypothetical protein A2X46_07910 [Lentisphaerae bacterium GWF2_57_35]HBA84626.1 hypothetical protein [Verrucomicrobiota bacterium]